MGIKLNMLKAYDRVEWSFLLKILSLFGFPDKYISWIEQCLSTMTYSIMLNGSHHGKFKPSGGLR